MNTRFLTGPGLALLLALPTAACNGPLATRSTSNLPATVAVTSGAFSIPDAQTPAPQPQTHETMSGGVPDSLLPQVAVLPPGTPIPASAVAQAIASQTAYGRTREVSQGHLAAQPREVQAPLGIQAPATSRPPRNLSEALSHPSVRATPARAAPARTARPAARQPARAAPAPDPRPAAPTGPRRF